jgi:hypothetical protein
MQKGRHLIWDEIALNEFVKSIAMGLVKIQSRKQKNLNKLFYPD